MKRGMTFGAIAAFVFSAVASMAMAQNFNQWDNPGHRPFTGDVREACESLLSDADCVTWLDRQASGECVVREMPNGQLFERMMSTHLGKHRVLKLMQVSYDGDGWEGKSRLAEYCHLRGHLWVVTPEVCDNISLLYAPAPPIPEQALCPAGYIPVDVPSADRPRIFTPEGFDPILFDGTSPPKCNKCTRWANGWAGDDIPPPDDPVWSMLKPVAWQLPHGTKQVCVRNDAPASFCDEDGSNDPTRFIYNPQN